MAEWLEPHAIEVPEALRQVVGGHPLVAEALVRRGVSDPEQARAFLDPACYRPRPAAELPHLPEALRRVAEAVRRRERILVWGDFDVDGLTATAILVEGLRALGAVVSHHVPGRTAGHGVQFDVLRGILAGANPPQLILTCDTGISAAAAVAYARGLGVDTVITDHHALPPDLPAARAIVNPCFLPADHPLRTLPGAGCAYLLVAALDEGLGGGACEQQLDLLALAIVADVAPLQGDVRYYLQRGLAALRTTERLGLQALYEAAGVARDGLDEGHVGFGLAPRLNALGRLGDPGLGLELLLTRDLTRARTIAAEMEGLNSRRQLLTGQVLQAAVEQVERDPASRQAPGVIAAHPAWPPGIVGLVAGRLAEQYGKPALVLATPADDLARGSARSVPGIDIAAAIASTGDLLVGHGGHPMAAGLSLRPEHLPELRRRLLAELARRAASAPPPPPLALDGDLPLAAATAELARDLARLAPFGPGCPPVRLAARRLTVVAQAAAGRSGEHRRLYLRDEAGRQHKVFWWQSAGRPLPEGIFDLAFTMRPHNYQGRDEVVLEWVDGRVVEPAAPTLIVAAPAYQVYDHRDDPAPLAALDAVCALGPLVVWAEGDLPPGDGAVSRCDAAAAEALAVWTAPPGPRELAELLRCVQPQRVHLFAVDPGLDEPEPFLRRLAGLVKYALTHYGGRIDAALLERMAAATAQRPGTVRCGLRWLAAQGQWTLIDEGKAGWRVDAMPAAADPTAARQAFEQLAALLAETAAYRSYARHADPHILLVVAPER
ncbi:MAG TPA: single-stranded-DNA-specific exonuclease RecJ [Anaerolineae bacterium]|nr:single-stranded-DNA-specific exonuclease RecJ [Anaerolineae bacterium]HOQ98313.1 single-stranded-DNA-specific exonuclease RecJ [Anaerolineae bacterium]HPL28874.1 single-stranded-DNA-specific exonuclease RecJ [Anaerolineae bacterium]